MLHQAGVERFANGIDHGGARIAVVASYADFDQFVAFEMHVNFENDGRCQARIADNHYGLKMMRARFECAALLGA